MKNTKEKNQKHFNKSLSVMFVQDREELTNNERGILQVLIRYCNDEGNCYCSYAQLRKKSGIKSDSTLSIILKSLEKKEFVNITRVTKNGEKKANQFELRFWKQIQLMKVSEILEIEEKSLNEINYVLGGTTIIEEPIVAELKGGTSIIEEGTTIIEERSSIIVDKDFELKIITKDKEVVVVREIQEYIDTYKITFKENLLEEQKMLINEMYKNNKDILLKSLKVLVGKTKPFSFLVSTFDNKIDKIKIGLEKAKTKKESDTKEQKQTHKKTKFHNFDETFTQYSSDEFQRKIDASQKAKFGGSYDYESRTPDRELREVEKELEKYKVAWKKSNQELLCISEFSMDYNDKKEEVDLLEAKIYDLKAKIENLKNPKSDLEPLKDVGNVITLSDFRNSNKGLIDKFKNSRSIGPIAITKNKDDEILDLKIDFI